MWSRKVPSSLNPSPFTLFPLLLLSCAGRFWLMLGPEGPSYLTLPLSFVYLISMFGGLLRWDALFLDLLGLPTSPIPSSLVFFVWFDLMICLLLTIVLGGRRCPKEVFILKEKCNCVDIIKFLLGFWRWLFFLWLCCVLFDVVAAVVVVVDRILSLVLGW